MLHNTQVNLVFLKRKGGNRRYQVVETRPHLGERQLRTRFIFCLKLNRSRGCLCVKAERCPLCRVNKSPLMGLHHIHSNLFYYFTNSRLGKWENIIYILACQRASKHGCNQERSEAIWQERPKRSFDLIYWCLLFPSLVRFRH